MTTTYKLNTSRTAAANGPSLRFHAGSGVASLVQGAAPREIPAVVPASQLYFWTEEWQEDEKAALQELAGGEGRVFLNAEDAIHWLLTVDDDD